MWLAWSLLAGLAMSGSLVAQTLPSPYDHGGEELVTPRIIVAGQSPLVYSATFDGERETYGYRPRFLPTGEVAFAPDNRPYIRATQPHLPHGDGTADGFIQTLGDDGRWLATPIVPPIRSLVPDWDGRYRTGVRVSGSRIVFDGDNDAYTIVWLMSTPYRLVLLHLPRGGDGWRAYAIPYTGGLRLERADRYGDIARPPVILREAGGQVWLCELEKTAAGAIEFHEPVALSEDKCFLHPDHSGAGPSSARMGDTTYVTFARSVAATGEAGEDLPGTPQYVVSYSHRTGEVSEPALIGFGHNCYVKTPDAHNAGCLVADSRGTLHVIIGAHQDLFWHVVSKTTAPRTAADWHAPVPINTKRHYDCGLTYVAVVIDRRDRVHIVARNLSRATDEKQQLLPPEVLGKPMRRTLDYLRGTRQPDGSWKWEEKGPLVVPYHPNYSIFYQKLTLDREDRLFLSYTYYAVQLTEEGIAAYRSKWPEEDLGPENNRVMPHDPVIMMSGDAGETWRLATTADFLAGMTID